MGTTGTQYAYDPMTNKWSWKASLGTPRGYLSYTQLDGKLYAIGGAITGSTVFPNNDKYDPVLDTWTARQGLTTARQGHVAAAVNGKLYVIAGTNELANTPSTE